MQTSQKIWAIIAGLFAWLAVLLQLYLILANRPADSNVGTVLVRFLSYFTIQSNILVAICYTAAGRKGFFSRPGTVTAIAVYIGITGLVYNLILRQLWAPQGLQLLVDEALHTVTPVLFWLYWLIFVPKAALRWKDIWPWLIYPLAYLLYILLRGALSGEYPYPFVDVNTLGYARVLQHALLLTVLFIVFSVLFVAIAKLIGRASPQKGS